MPVATAVETPRAQVKAGSEWGATDRSGSLRLIGCGVDTWKPAWYVDPDSPASRWFEEQPSRPGTVAEGGGWVLRDKIAEHKIGIAASGLIWADGHPSPDGLAKAGELKPAYDRLRDELELNGVPIPDGIAGYDVKPRIHKQRVDRARALELSADAVGTRRPGAAGFTRLDVTADFETPSQAYGHELMKGLNAATFSRGRARCYGSLGFWETIVIASPNGKRVLGRIYDKGLESQTAARGRLLRAEDQGRFNATRRRSIEHVDAAFLCERFRRRFRAYADASREQGEVTVGDPLTICARLQAMCEAGELDGLRAERLAGTIVLDYLAGNSRRGERTTTWRRRRELRELGLVTDAGELTEGSMTIALHEPFDLVADAAAWQ